MQVEKCENDLFYGDADQVMTRSDDLPLISETHRDTVPLRRLRVWLQRLYWAIFVFVLIAVPWSLYLEYRQALANSERQTLSLLRSLDEHLMRTFASVEQAMQNVAEDVTRDGGVSQIDEKQIHEKLKDKTQLTPQVRGIIAIDEQGILRAHGLEYPTRQVSLADRPYFLIHRASPDPKPMIGIPIVSRTDYKWLIPVTQRITTKDGRFGGVILAGVEPDYFLSFYRFLNLAPGTQIQLTLESGVIMLGYPMNNAAQGKNARDSDPYYDQILASPGTLLQLRDPQKSEYTFVAQQHLSGQYPILIRVTQEESQVLGLFYQDAIRRFIAAVFCLLLYSALHYLLMRQLTRAEATESRLRLTQHTVDVSPDMVMWIQDKTKIIYSNDKLVSVSGYPSQVLYETPVDQLITLESASWSDWGGTTPLRTRTVLEGSLLAADGRCVPVELAASDVAFDGQRYLCITARDITDHLAAAQELKNHRDNLQQLVGIRTAEIQAILDASPLAIALSTSGRLKMVNRAFESLFACDATSIENQSERTLFASDAAYRQATEAILAKVSRDQTFRREIELQRSDGGSFWAVFFARALSPETPSAGLIYIIEDNTPQRSAAQALRQSERLMRSVLDTTADSFALIDAHHSFVEVNRALCIQTGRNAAELMLETPASIWGEDLATKLFPWDAETISSHPFVEIVLPDRTGRLCPYLVSRGLIHDENGGITHAFAFLTEITHQKEIEQSLIQAKNSAEQASAAKTLFLTNMSHELRTPMHAILSFSEMGIQKVEHSDTTTLRRYFERIEASGRRLLKMLNDLLDMSKLEANKMQYRFERHCLQHTFQAASRELSSLLSNKQLTIVTDDRAPRLIATYDQERINQVFINLLSNAIKFSPDGSTIHVDFIDNQVLGNATQAVGLSIRDEGPGIKEEDLQAIFEAFIQSEQATTKGGTGLGLAISRRVVSDHQGRLWAENSPEGGAVFKLLLPIQGTSTQQPTTASS